MTSEAKMQIIKEILPDTKEALCTYIREQAEMVLIKRCLISDLDPLNEKYHKYIELEAMVLASTIQTGLIDTCFELCTGEKVLK